MVEALQKPGCREPMSMQRIKVRDTDIPLRQLSDFVTQNSMKLFTALELNIDFLYEHRSAWDALDSFREARVRVMSLKVVNDAAERSVALIQSFNAVLTNQEEQKQFLLQAVEKHRKNFPEFSIFIKFFL